MTQNSIRIFLSILCVVSVTVLANESTIETRLGPITIAWNDDRYTGYDSYGKPLNITNINDSLPVSFLSEIYSKIPDGQSVNPAFIDEDSKTNLVVDSDFNGTVTVNVTFMNEGAGYRNSFGYFIYDPQNPPQSFTDIPQHMIVFPNASKPNGGFLQQGDTVPLNVTLTAGQAMGFFVIPNGYGWGTNPRDAEVGSSGSGGQPFYSIPSLNPEPAGERNHNVVFFDPDSQLLVVGFEDVYLPNSDNDYNDIIFSLDVTPIEALVGIDDSGNVEEDGFNDLDAFVPPPGSTSYYPSQSGKATLMFEDLWPRMGDYDFNDLVVEYNYKIDKDYLGRIEAVEMTYTINAIGAGFHNGFALHLPEVLKSNIASATLTHDQQSISISPEEEALETVFILSADVWEEVSTSCSMYRTVSYCNDAKDTAHTLTVEFTEPVEESSLGLPPYDPFIFATPGKPHGDFSGRQWEVHLKQFSGTSLFNADWFGMYDDSSNIVNSFVNENNMPWALNISDSLAHPLEGKDIQTAYPNFADWAKSNGAQHTDWYERINAVVENIFE